MPSLKSLVLSLAALGSLSGIGPSAAHEFWISPDVYSVAPGEPMTAQFRVGQAFKGVTLSYSPNTTERFEAGPVGGLAAVTARLGDRPALNVPAAAEGLNLVVVETADSVLTYDDWAKFTDFDAFHDLGNAADAHLARGLPQTGFVETYRRYAKALIAVGDGAGADARLGLDVEIVLETNPYTEMPGTPMQARLYQDGVPRRDGQLEQFTRSADGTVARAVLRSDAEGLVELPSEPGSEVMLNFTTLTPLDGDAAAREPVWHSRWASLTYAVPAAE
jgi:hypothetical protein